MREFEWMSGVIARVSGRYTRIYCRRNCDKLVILCLVDTYIYIHKCLGCEYVSGR